MRILRMVRRVAVALRVPRDLASKMSLKRLSLFALLLFGYVSARSSNDDEILLNETFGYVAEPANSSICTAVTVKVVKQIQVFDLPELECADQLETVLVDGVGLSLIQNASLPSTVKNLSVINNDIKKIGCNVFSNRTFEHLNLSSNKIECIERDAFDYMPNLKSVILDYNELTVYNLDFVECRALKLISLKFNKIKQLPEGMLKPIKNNVLTVNFAHNKIEEIHNFAFNVKQFHEVHLEHNELKSAQFMIKLVKADLVDLSANRITCLPKEFMENGLSKIKVLNLTDNPLECSCLQDLKRKMRKNVEFQKMSPLVQNINIILPMNDTKKC